MENQSLLLVDDDQETTGLLSNYLSSEGFCIDCIDNGEAGLTKARCGRHYDLILLNAELPLMNGFEVLQNLRQSHLTPVILLATKDDEFERIYGLEIGADDYLPKPFNFRELLARIKALLRRIGYMQSSQFQPSLRAGGLEIDNISGNVSFSGINLAFTGTEFSIIQLLLINKGKMTSKNDISEAVFGRKLEPYDRSIDMHMSNVRKKISVHTSNEYIRTIRGVGYMMVEVWSA